MIGTSEIFFPYHRRVVTNNICSPLVATPVLLVLLLLPTQSLSCWRAVAAAGRLWRGRALRACVSSSSSAGAAAAAVLVVCVVV